ncbi:hypothetical protein [Brevundimonas subvibrioides]|uniref:hypothetical protein n=1 Tax=Brevundimonas subvibrioides TaxID=74313 RepID=UPI0022B2EF39|nr:hypothetical protein [Brevundimonas subvibrioides]
MADVAARPPETDHNFACSPYPLAMPDIWRQSVGMLVIALISLAVSTAQEGAVPYGTPVYAPPVVRPYEPPSNFGRIVAEGDGGGDVTRRPIVRPVAVESYRGSYEYAPTTAEEAYNRGVAQAETSMDARMGPLDGLWRVRDAAGNTLISLALTDPGSGRPVEGAWRKDGGRGELGVIEQVERTDDAVTLVWSQGRLVLRAGAPGWTGELTLDGRAVPVTISR